MKPSSFRKVALATAWFILFSAFTPGKKASPPTPASGSNTSYYYYLEPGDTFDSYNTVAGEISRLESITGLYVDTNPFGGTLVAKGYTNNIVPHTIWPSSYLYSHD